MTGLARQFVQRNRQRGMTLTELLVVLAIVIVLVAIMLPVLSGLQASRERLTCAASMHNLSLSVTAFAIDYRGALPDHYADPAVSFDTFWMQNEYEPVNLGQLTGYIADRRTFYCVTQTNSTSSDIGFETTHNQWEVPGRAKGKAKGIARGKGKAKGHDGDNVFEMPVGLNSSYPARARSFQPAARPRWTVTNHLNKVIYSDFIGVDGWLGMGRFKGIIRSPHDSAGYNRLFGDGAVQWADAAPLESLRPIDATEPTDQELFEYYELLDVLP